MEFAFDAVFYYVTDVDRSVQFYRDTLGFTLTSHDVVARFDIGGVLFEVVPTREQKFGGFGNARVCLKVDNIAAAISELRAKGVRVDNAAVKENGILASFYDPDGNELCLWQYT